MNRPTYAECVVAALQNADFCRWWAELRNVTLPRNGLERLIDKATGHNDAIAQMFLEDVYDLVYSRIQ